MSVQQEPAKTTFKYLTPSDKIIYDKLRTDPQTNCRKEIENVLCKQLSVLDPIPALKGTPLDGPHIVG